MLKYLIFIIYLASGTIIMFIKQKRNLRHKKIKGFAQGHITSEW